MQEETANFMRAAAGAGMHQTTASLAAAAMNAAKPTGEPGMVDLGRPNYAPASNTELPAPMKVHVEGGPAAGSSETVKDAKGPEERRVMDNGQVGTYNEMAKSFAAKGDYDIGKIYNHWQGLEIAETADKGEDAAAANASSMPPAAPEWDNPMMNQAAMQQQAAMVQMMAAHQQHVAQQATLNPWMAQMMMMPPWMIPPMDPSMGKSMPPFMQMYGGMSAMPGASGMPQNASPKNKSGGQKGGDKKERKPRRGKPKGNQSASPDLADMDDNKTRSEELMEVRRTNGKGCKLTLAEVMPHVVEFSKDQHGSRYLQNLLEPSQNPSEREKQQAFEAILPETKQLANDIFGNFVIQKFFDLGTVEMKKQLVEQMRGDILKLSLETYGCRVIQKAVALVPRATQLILAEELRNSVPKCIQDMHGNFVIQKCIEQMPPEHVSFIIDAVSDDVEKWATHTYGCRVIQRLLEHCQPNMLQRVSDQILLCIPKLATDNFGNYVVQHILEHGSKEEKSQIIKYMQQDIVKYSINKQSSNVVEKCFVQSPDEDRQGLYQAVLKQDTLKQMIDDKFGNYIVQRMIEYSRGEDRVRVRNALLQHQDALRSSVNGKHILNTLNKEFGESLQ
mmetsp:Transcript_156890/g.273072  ORF Transcript_156890/g.273072 Transcript_156890/m.273072 type:complete len:618 (-) Transcript_156890:442-2295(-)